MTGKKIIMLSAIALLGCTAVKQTTTLIPPKAVSEEAVSQGKELYDARCGKCHKLPVVAKYTAARWPAILNSMQKKAKITNEQKELIYAYVYSGAK